MGRKKETKASRKEQRGRGRASLYVNAMEKGDEGQVKKMKNADAIKHV